MSDISDVEQARAGRRDPGETRISFRPSSPRAARSSLWIENAWGVYGIFTHYWTPEWRSNVAVGYVRHHAADGVLLDIVSGGVCVQNSGLNTQWGKADPPGRRQHHLVADQEFQHRLRSRICPYEVGDAEPDFRIHPRRRAGPDRGQLGRQGPARTGVLIEHPQPAKSRIEGSPRAALFLGSKNLFQLLQRARLAGADAICKWKPLIWRCAAAAPIRSRKQRAKTADPGRRPP